MELTKIEVYRPYVIQELYMRIAETCIQGVEVIWSHEFKCPFSLGNCENGHDVSYQGDHVYSFIQYHVKVPYYSPQDSN